MKVESTGYFEKELARLKKKFPLVLAEMVRLRNQFHGGLQPGDQIPDMGYETYKVRLPNPSAKRGKSGGFRVIYYLRKADFILLLTIYSKTEQDDVPGNLLRQLIEEYEAEQGKETESDVQTDDSSEDKEDQ